MEGVQPIPLIPERVKFNLVRMLLIPEVLRFAQGTEKIGPRDS